MSYCAYVTVLTNVRKAENSDRLYLAECFGEGVIVGPGSAVGERVLYLPADGQVEHWFGDKFSLFRKNEDGSLQGGYLEQNGHIKAIRLRGNRSEGIVIPISKIYAAFGYQGWKNGQEVDSVVVNGKEKRFCKKYIPKHTTYYMGQRKSSYKGRKAEGIVYPEFALHSDTKQLAYNLNAFKPGDKINLTLKMHGTSQRSMMTYGELPRSWFRKLFHMKSKIKPSYVLGTRRTVVCESNDGFYGNDEFRLEHHNALKPFVQDSLEVYYEVVGYYGPQESQTIMPICDNSKLGKDFVKEFGDSTIFSYGCKPGESDFYVYRITANNGEYEFSPDEIIDWCNQAHVKYVPQIDNFIFTTKEDLYERINKYFEDLHDPIGKTHIKEGVVVRIVNRNKFEAYKSKCFEFKVLTGIANEKIDTSKMTEDIASEI
jgi:hypothetical protein